MAERSLSRYRELAEDDEDRELADRIGSLFRSHTATGKDLLDLMDEQDAARTRIDESFARLKTATDAQGEVSGSGGAEKAILFAGLESDAAEASSALHRHCNNAPLNSKRPSPGCGRARSAPPS